MVQDHEEHLEHSPCPQDPAAGQEDISFKGHETGFDDVAGNDHIDAHIGETPFPRFIHNILFPQVQTNENQQEERQLEIPQSINIHGTASLGQFFMTHRAAMSYSPVGSRVWAKSSSQAPLPHRYRAWGWEALAARKMVLATSWGCSATFGRRADGVPGPFSLPRPCRLPAGTPLPDGQRQCGPRPSAPAPVPQCSPGFPGRRFPSAGHH